MTEQNSQFGAEKETAIRTAIFRNSTAIFRNSMQFSKSSTIHFFGSPKCQKIASNYRKIPYISVKYARFDQFEIEIAKNAKFSDPAGSKLGFAPLELAKKSWVLAMATKPSWSCETLQQGTTLLGKNAEGPQESSDLDQLIRVFWLQNQTYAVHVIFCALPNMFKIFSLEFRSIPLRLNKRRLQS